MGIRNIGWSDECGIWIGRKTRQKCRRRAGDDKYNKKFLTPAFKQPKIRIMVWASISYGCKGPLVRLRRRTEEEWIHKNDKLGFNSHQYITEVLEPHFLPWWHEIHGIEGDMRYMENDSKVHQGKK